MGKRKKSQKFKLIQDRTAEVMVLASQYDFRVAVYSDRPRHLRVFGETVVDYWPSTGRMWRTGSAEKATAATPAELLEAASCRRIVVDQDAVISHMRSIASEVDENDQW